MRTAAATSENFSAMPRQTAPGADRDFVHARMTDKLSGRKVFNRADASGVLTSVMVRPNIEALRGGRLRQSIASAARRPAAPNVRSPRWAYLVLLPVLLGLSSCGTTRAVGPGPEMSAADIAARYRLGPGDRFRLTVFNQPNISNEYVVDGGGVVALPLIGPTKGGDQTTRELEQAIAKELTRRGFLNNPSVSVQVVEFRPYYILGEVANPGSYPYTVNLTVRKAVAAARGFTYRANTRRVYIQRAGESTERLYELTPGTAVLPGDTLRIPERLF